MKASKRVDQSKKKEENLLVPTACVVGKLPWWERRAVRRPWVGGLEAHGRRLGQHPEALRYFAPAPHRASGRGQEGYLNFQGAALKGCSETQQPHVVISQEREV